MCACARVRAINKLPPPLRSECRAYASGVVGVGVVDVGAPLNRNIVLNWLTRIRYVRCQRSTDTNLSLAIYESASRVSSATHTRSAQHTCDMRHTRSSSTSSMAHNIESVCVFGHIPLRLQRASAYIDGLFCSSLGVQCVYGSMANVATYRSTQSTHMMDRLTHACVCTRART